MHDPTIKKIEQSDGTAYQHVHSALRNVFKKKWLILIFISLAFVTAGRFIWYEYYQLFSLKREVIPVLFGLMLALIHIGNILGSEFAHRVTNPNKVLFISFAALIISTLALIVISGSFTVMLFLVMCFFGSQASAIILDENLQHETTSELRATTLSLSNLISRIFFGIAAGIILIFHAMPEVIAITTLVSFLCVAIYLPARKRLASPVAFEKKTLPLSDSTELKHEVR